MAYLLGFKPKIQALFNFFAKLYLSYSTKKSNYYFKLRITSGIRELTNSKMASSPGCFALDFNAV